MEEILKCELELRKKSDIKVFIIKMHAITI